MHVPRRRRAVIGVLLAFGVFLAMAAAATAAPPGFKPIDQQEAEYQDDMTWEDYKTVPGTDWANPALQPTIEKWKVAIVLTEFADQPLNITMPAGATIFGNPQTTANSIPRAQAAQFYEDFLNTPSLLNHFTTMNSYWMETSLGRYGVELEAYGPYTLTGNQWEYWLRDAGNAGSACPTGFTCNRNARTEVRALWEADVGSAVVASYDNIIYQQAGQDESSTWQEFGEMMFQTMNDVTEAFGNPDPTKPNWSPTRYIPWTSFAAGKGVWPSAGGNTFTAAESSGAGTYAHELSHNLGIADNYNNPYGIPQRRDYSGPWDMLSRGSFNGPGGPHRRWLIPSTEGGSLGASQNFRNRMELDIIDEQNILRLDRNALDESGVVVARVTARVADPGPDGLTGVNIELNPSPDLAFPTRGDQSPVCNINTDPFCPGPTANAAGVISQIEPLQQLHGRGRRPARRGLVHARPRRPLLEDEEPGQPAVRLHHGRASRGHEQGRLPQARRDALDGDDRGLAPAQRRHVPCRSRVREPVRVRGPAQPAPLLRHRDVRAERRA